MTPRLPVLLATAAAVLAPAAAHAACPGLTVTASGGTSPFSVSPSRATTYQLRNRHVRTKSDNGVSIEGAPPGTCILDPTVTQTQSRALPWSTVEHGYPYDCVHWSHSTPGAPVVVRNAHLANCTDAFGPPKSNSTARGSFAIDGGTVDFVRDDIVENDGCETGSIVGLRGTGHTFLSERNSTPCSHKGTVTVRNVDIHLVCMAQTDKHSAGCPNGQATGSIFKWGPGSGCVNMSNSTFVLDAVPASGVDNMAFPCGHYSNVTVFWRGPGAYPAKVPPGVTVR